jgi:predicted NBD/HSP70 family sugar kinase
MAKFNERQVLRAIEERGPCSRADVVRRSGLSAPTVSKAAASLLEAGLLEEVEGDGPAVGRPAMRLRLANASSQVLGVVINVGHCCVIATGLDGEVREGRVRPIETPATYKELIDALITQAWGLMARPGMRTLGFGVSVPGLIDHRRGRDLLSPNMHLIDGRSPARDLGKRLGLEGVMIQDMDALCLAERHFGLARSLDDFALFDVSTGIGMGVMSGGRLLRGNRGFAGEIGHITVCPDGPPCGCGNRGCLETVASVAAIARRVARRLGRAVDDDEVIRLAQSGGLDREGDCGEFVQYLAIGLAAVINLFNPSTLFIHGRLFEVDEALFGLVLERIRERALAPSLADCHIVRSGVDLQQGAVAAVIRHLIDSVVPTGP